MLSWSEVRAVQAAGIEIGSHGRLHELQHGGQPSALRAEELVESKATIERETGRPCDSFAFPNGTFHDASPDEVRAAGYLRGFSMLPRSARRTDDPFLVPRLGAPAPVDKMIATLVFGS
jgi:peptidoglycan/xylan/chitin deacetylase (PgdA/CDA1 family)